MKKPNIKNLWKWRYKSLRIWFLVGVLFTFIPWKLPFFGANIYQQKGFFMGGINYRTAQKEDLPKSFSKKDSDWCVKYGFWGLDGGDSGAICGDNRLITILGPAKCIEDKSIFGYCSIYQENIIANTYSTQDIKDINSGKFGQILSSYEGSDISNPLGRLVAKQRRLISAWGDFDAKTDWNALSIHHGKFWRIGALIRIFFTLISAYLIPLFLISILLIIEGLSYLLRRFKASDN